MKPIIPLVALATSCLVLSCASDSHEADEGVKGTLHSAITDRDVDIDVDHGVVTLEGKVNTEADRERIENLARQTAGVVAVKDNLKVKLPTPGDFGAIPGSTPLQTAPPLAVVPQPPTVVTAPVEAVPVPAQPAPPIVLVPNTPTVQIQPITVTDQIAAERIAQQIDHDAVPVPQPDHVIITVNSGNAFIKGSVDGKSEHDELLASVQRAGGLNTIYDQLVVR